MTHEALAGYLARYTLTVEDAAAQLGVLPDTLRQAVRDGRLPSIKVLGTIRLAQEDLQKVVSVRGAANGEEVSS